MPPAKLTPKAWASPVVNMAYGPVAAETVAAIAAAISAVLSSPYRLLSVQQVTVPVAHCQRLGFGRPHPDIHVP